MNEIVIYQTKELTQQIEVRIDDETIWLTQAQIVELFDSSKANISEHIKHIFQTGELTPEATVRDFRTVRKEGNRTVYHFGASLKDAGKKWFAFSKLDINANDIIEKL